ncbi:MAG: S8 family serine peptidase [Neomegalonema sp.]|nr:S8 family serine peptidase [Neomegalonema sp.]
MRMKLLRIGTALGALMLMLSWSLGPEERAQAQPLAAPGEVIAILDNAARAKAFIALAEQRGYALRFSHTLGGLGLEMVTLALRPGINAEKAIVELETIAPYSVVGQNHVYTLSQAPQPRLFAREVIQWPLESCVARIKIGVIDTPVPRSRLRLAADEIVTASFLRRDERPSSHDHGASIAAILAGPAGLLSEATLFAAVAVMEDSSGKPIARVDHLARSINWMAESGVKVVNLSLAGPRNKIFAKVVESAARRGMILVAAVGNNGPKSPALYPAAFKDVIAVTAIDAARRVYSRAVRGDHIDVAAPGVDIWLFGAENQRYASGTSLAAPYVAARLAVAAARGLTPDVASARALLTREAVDLGAAGRDPVFGAGLLRGPSDCS